MATVAKTAGVAGNVTLTTRNTAGQAIVPVSVPVVQWYTDAARTAGALTLTTTGSGSTYTASWTAPQAPATPATRYLKVTIEVSTGVFDTDADDDIGFVAASAIISGTYVTKAELRELPNLADTAKFADAQLDAAIAWFEAKFEHYTGIAWVPRSATERLSGDGSTSVLLGHYPVRSVTSVTVYTTATTSTAFTAAELADLVIDTDIGMIRRSSLGGFTAGTGNIVITYTHGYESPPADVKEAALVAIRDHLLDSNVGNRQFSVQTEQGVVRTSLPGPDRPFGIPFVDDVANARRGAPAIA